MAMCLLGLKLLKLYKKVGILPPPQLSPPPGPGPSISRKEGGSWICNRGIGDMSDCFFFNLHF